MCRANRESRRRPAFTLIELLVVVAIILAIAALAAAFAPRISDNTNLSRAVDNLEQWLLTAKMRAKRDGLATGLRFVQAQGDAAGAYSQFQYIQQPDALSGGWLSANQSPSGSSVPYNGMYLNGGILTSAVNGTVSFANVDFSMGGAVLAQGLVQPGDYLEVRDGGVYLIGSVLNATTLQLTGSGYDTSLSITTPTTNYRILRQPRILIGEEPVTMPNNFAVDTNQGGNVQAGSSGSLEILFSPSGAVVGSNAGNGITVMIVRDMTINPVDTNREGIVAVQGRTGFIGAYGVAPGADPFAYVETGRASGL